MNLLTATNATFAAPLASNWEWFRPASSTGAQSVDDLFWFITWVSIFFFVLIVGMMGWFMAVYRKRPGHTVQPSPHHNNALEATWSIIPLFIVIVIFAWGFSGFLDLRTPPDDAYEIDVVAQKWNWSFKYPDGVISPNLHVEEGRPVKLVMASNDVLHSLYIPAFRVKMDCVPGKYTYLWFEPTETTPDADGGDVAALNGGFDLFCAEYCGTGHSTMYAKVVVHEKGGLVKWLAREKDPIAKGLSSWEHGEKLYTSRGCKQCHSIDGTDRAANGGPSFKGYFGKDVSWTNGASGEVDRDYIRESILNPQAKIRTGFENVKMPTYQGQLSEKDLRGLVDYIRHLNGADTRGWEGFLDEETKEPGADSEAETEGDGTAGDGAAGDEAAGPESKDPKTAGTDPAEASPVDADEAEDASAEEADEESPAEE